MEKFDWSIQTFWVLLIYLCLSATGLDISQNYFTDVRLLCNDSSSQNTSKDSRDILTNQAWLLPNGEVLQNGHETLGTKNVRVVGKESTLYIDRIDDANFGIYWCVQVWNDTGVVAMRHTVNIDGPPMHEFYERQKKNAIVGAAAAGVVFSVILVTYIIWYFKCSEKVRRKRRLAEDLTKGINRYSTQIYDNIGMDLYVKKADK